MSTPPRRQLCDKYIADIKRAVGMSPRVEAAFRHIPRDEFILAAFGPVEKASALPSAEEIYSDSAIGTVVRHGVPVSSSSRPSLMATMLDLLAVEKGMNVLEVGTGTGYNAAILAYLVGDRGRVVTTEVHPGIARLADGCLNRLNGHDVTVLVEDGYDGAPLFGPFDRIIVTVGSFVVSPNWLAQVSTGGRILVPLEHGGAHPLVDIRKVRHGTQGIIRNFTGFMRGQGRLGGEWWPTRLAAGDPDRREPMWANFSTSSDRSRMSYDVTEDEAGFMLYLSVRDRRAARHPAGFGLVDGGSFAVVGTTEICSRGNDRVLADLRDHFKSWRIDGRPRLADFCVRFVGAAESAGMSKPGWLIPRGELDQWTTLRPRPTDTPKADVAGL